MNQTFHEFEISICNLSWNEHRNWFYLKAPLHITSSGCGYNLVQPTRHRPRRYKRWKESSDDTHSVVNNERINKQLNHEGYGKLDSSFLRKFYFSTSLIQYFSPQGLFAVTLAVCLVSMTVAQPIVFLDPLTAASFTTAGGLVLTSAAGSTATIPTGALVLGGLAAKKLALLKILEAQQQ